MRSWLAQRAAQSEASPTIMANQRAEELRRKGIDVVSLTVGEPDFVTPAHIRDACKKALDEGFTKYTPSAGIPELKEAVAEKSKRENGIPADAAHTLITPTKHALFATLMATVEPGDEVIVPDPCFVSYAPQIKFFGGVPVPVALKPERGLSLHTPDVAKAVTPRTKAIMLCSPSNPTGMVDAPDEVKAVVELAQRKDLLIISDEIYEKVLYEGRHLSPASLPGGWERTVTINGLSKAYAMTGWRTGWLHAPSPLFEAIARIQTQTITQVTSFVQKGSVAALKGPQDSVGQMVAEFQARRDLVMKEVSATPGWSMMRPQGAFYAWVKFDQSVSADTMQAFLLDEAHVATVSGSAFGRTGEGHLRLSYATSREKIQEAFRRIRETLPRLKMAAAKAR